MVVYDKLIRDGILDRIQSEWKEAKYHIAEIEEYERRLLDKLLEESKELQVAENIEERKKELGDVLEVIEAIVDHFWFDMEEIQKIKKEKYIKSWWFAKKIILEGVL